MTLKRSHTIAPLTKLTSDKVPFKWKEEHQTAYDTVKTMLSKETLLRYPDFSKEFEIHTDASKAQLGTKMAQGGQPIAFYSRRLTDAQTRYTTTERELLAIVETLKEFRSILLGQKIVIHTDHKNLTYANFNTDRVIRWRLIIEEYGPELQYVEGPKNVVADALSRLGLKDNPEFKDKLEQCLFYEEQIMSLQDHVPIKSMPIDLEYIKQHQKDDKALKHLLKKDKRFHLKSFHGAGLLGIQGAEWELLCYNNRIVIPKSLQENVLEWYHYILVHPGRDRTLKTISQHFYWKGMANDVEKYCKKCSICQTSKVSKKKY